MEEIIKALQNADLEEIADLLYGDGAYVVAKALSPEQKKERRDKTLQNIAIGTNAIGSVAGPAAIGLAYRSAKKNEGGTPRAYAPNVISRMQNRQGSGKVRPRPLRVAGMKTQKVVNALNRPGSHGRAAKIGAAATGATLVGLQGINWGGDILSAKLIGDQKKKEQVKKNIEEKRREPRKLTLVRISTDAAFEAARKAPKAAEKVGKSVTWHGEISKMDSDKRQVFGWASVIEVDGKPVVDLQQDIMELEEIEKAAYDYVVKSRKGGHQHQRSGEEPLHVSDMIESFVVTPEKKEQLGLPAEMPTGWWVGFQVNDDEVWKAVKDGKLPGFSIHGSGTRTPVEG